MIRKVWMNNFSGQLLVTIPSVNDSTIVDGDFVEVRRVEPPMNGVKCKSCSKPYVKHTVEELYAHKLLKARE